MAAVEFALVAPLLILLFMGGLSLTAAIYDQQVLTDACRDAARQGVVAVTGGANQGYSAATTTATSDIGSRLIDFGSGQAVVTPNAIDGCTTGPSCRLMVTATFNFTPLASAGIGVSIPLTGSATMYYE